MSVPISELWRLLMESRLLTHEQCQHLSAEFSRSKYAPHANAKVLAEWLVKSNVVSRYQARLLLAGRPGPFYYGDYVVYDRVSQGRFAGAFRAIHTYSRHPVLLQFLAGAVTGDEDAWQTLVRQIQQEVGVVHPHLQRYFELVDLDAYKFLVLEDLHGDTVAERLAAGKAPPQDACRIVRQAALALHDLHLMGRVHGDVRPKNLFLEGGNRLKLVRDWTALPAPFPWGRPDPQGDLLARTNYLAPELSHTGRPPDPQTDIYALGCTLYEMLTGQPPFPGDDALQKMQQHATARIRPVEEFGAPAPLGQIVAYMMAKNRQVRYQEAANVAEQLTPYVNPADLAASLPAPAPTLAGFETHLRQKQVAEEQRHPGARRAVVVGVGQAGGGDFAAAPVAKERVVVSPRPSGAPDFTAIAAKAPQIAASPPRTQRSRAEWTPQKLAMLLGAIAAVTLLTIVGVNLMRTDAEPTPKDVALVDNTAKPLPTEDLSAHSGQDSAGEAETKVARPQEPTGPMYQVVADDGVLPWASPTSGPPLNLAYAPPGAQMFFAFRPADILASAYGSQVMKALGPKLAANVQAWETAAGAKLSEVAQVVVALHDNGGNIPRPSFVVRMKEPLDEATLLSRWGNPPPQAQSDGAVYSARGWSYFIPESEKGVFVMGAASEVQEVAKNPAARPLLRREMEQLLRVSDLQRHVTVLFAPSFLFSDGQKLFSGDLQKLQTPLENFLGDGLQAGMASMHFGDPFYVEMRLSSTLDLDKGKLAAEMRDRMAQLPNQIEDYIVRLSPHPYWRRLALRIPPMIRFLHQQTRIGTEGDHAIINAMLPGVAAPNLAAGAELTLVSQPGASYVADAAPAKPMVATIEELLDHPLSLRFPQQSLDFAMRDLATEVRDAFPNLPFPFDIKLMGKDLEMNGITQNQQIRDFAADNRPVKEILTAMVMKANPITTVKAPNETDQKLIWVVGPDPADASKQIILITTRDAAAQKNYTLPEVFQ